MSETTPNPQGSSEKETDLLRYRGNNVPRILRFAWTALVIFSVFYLIKYMVPDLRVWLSK